MNGLGYDMALLCHARLADEIEGYTAKAWADGCLSCACALLAKGPWLERIRPWSHPMVKFHKPPLAPNEYQCGICEGIFEKGRSDEEAAAEAAIDFPGINIADSGLVCDVCYNKHIATAKAAWT